MLTPKTLRTDEALAEFRSHEADAAVVVAYGMILPQAILDAPKLGCYNLHASLLPRWRGAAPINRAIMAGDGESGVMVMKMDVGLDTGPVAMVERVAISPDMTAGELHDKLSPLGADLMVRALAALDQFKPCACQQAVNDGLGETGGVGGGGGRLGRWPRHQPRRGPRRRRQVSHGGFQSLTSVTDHPCVSLSH